MNRADTKFTKSTQMLQRWVERIVYDDEGHVTLVEWAIQTLRAPLQDFSYDGVT